VENQSLDAATLRELVNQCRACRLACEAILDEWSDERCASGDFAKVVASAATFAVIADRLETGGTIPRGLVAFALTLADKTCRADGAASRACSAASNSLRELLDRAPGDATVA
jgi:hypothetical protein